MATVFSAHGTRPFGLAVGLAVSLLAALSACSSEDAAPAGSQANGTACVDASTCGGGVCLEGVCRPGSATDKVRNNGETDVDCGGTSAPPCATGLGCAVDNDCVDRVCTGGKCALPSGTDGRKNGQETDLDCGGPSAAKCPTGLACNANNDCVSRRCSSGRCAEGLPDNGVADGDETDIDCGGTKAPKCYSGRICSAATDCESGVCTTALCAAPTAADGVKNGTESDVDCGGTSGVKCAVGKRCNAHIDCASEGCDYKGTCIAARSCAAHYGGDTCGVGEPWLLDGAGNQVPDPAMKHESCCTSLPVPGVAGTLDKYLVTSGRIQQFMARVDGNVRGYVQANPPAGWNPAWNSYVPAGWNDVAQLLGAGTTGAGEAAGCYLRGNGGRTFWLPTKANTVDNGDIDHGFSKDVLDTKAQNCFTGPILAAFCAWDGGRLPTMGELRAALGGRTYPWGNTAWNPDLAIFNKLYAWPTYPQNADLDRTALIAAPGRRPLGYGPFGHADLAGLLFEYSAGLTVALWQGSFEGHAISMSDYAVTPARKYWAIGGRCAR